MLKKKVEVPVPTAVEYTATAVLSGIRDEVPLFTSRYYSTGPGQMKVPDAIFMGKGSSPEEARKDLIGKLWTEVGVHNKRADVVRAQIEALDPRVG